MTKIILHRFNDTNGIIRQVNLNYIVQIHSDSNSTNMHVSLLDYEFKISDVEYRTFLDAVSK